MSVIAGYDTVVELLADSAMSADKADSTTGFVGQRLPPALDANLLNIDGERHRRVRRLAQEGYSSRRTQRTLIADSARELAATLPSGGPADLVRQWSEPFPALVIGRLLGLPEDALDEFRDAARPLFRIDTSLEGEGIREAMARMLTLVMTAVAQRRKTPGDDMLSHWIAARDGDDRLSEEELMSLAFATIIGGFENVTALISGVFLELLTGPERDVVALPDGEFEQAMREAISKAAPVNYALRRFPLRDLHVGGHTIPRGETVVLSLRSANEDPGRGDRRDVVFGHGRHACPGSGIAAMEVAASVRAVFGRYPHIGLRVDPADLRLKDSWATQVLDELPVHLG